jgi:uncharacterized protein YbjT (DUF2867 family)
VILVTGATGTVGSSLVTALSSAGHPVRALVQAGQAVPSSWTGRVEAFVGDLGDRASLVNAIAGVDAIYLLVPAHPEMARYERNVIAVAADSAGSRRVVLHAAAGVDRRPEGVRFLAAHAEGLADLRVSGLPWTVLAPNGFLQNVIDMAGMVHHGVLELPAGAGAVSYVDAIDVAAAAAVVLTTEGHDYAIYPLTGPEALTHGEIAERLGTVLGHPVRYEPVSTAQARAGIGEGEPGAWQREGMIELLGLYGSGVAAAVTDDLPRLIGRPAHSLEDYLAKNASAVRAAASATYRGVAARRGHER